MTTDDLPSGKHNVCPRCGSAADRTTFCAGCGLNLAKQGELPTADAYAARAREERWLAAKEQGDVPEAETAVPSRSALSEPTSERRSRGEHGSRETSPLGARPSRRFLMLTGAAVVAVIVGVGVALLAGGGDDGPTESAIQTTSGTERKGTSAVPSDRGGRSSTRRRAEIPPTLRIVPGEGIGDISIGMPRAEVEARLGPGEEVELGSGFDYEGGSLSIAYGESTTQPTLFDDSPTEVVVFITASTDAYLLDAGGTRVSPESSMVKLRRALIEWEELDCGPANETAATVSFVLQENRGDEVRTTTFAIPEANDPYVNISVAPSDEAPPVECPPE